MQKFSKNQKIIGGIILVLSLCVCSGIANTLSGTDNATTTPIAHVATSIPKPTTTPRPLTDEQKIQAIVSAVSYGEAKVSYDAANQTVTITWDLTSALTTAENIRNIHKEAFILEKAVWTQWKGHLTAVGVLFTMLDPTTNTHPDVGVAMLFAKTESTFDWVNLDAETAWGMYDQAQD